MRRKAQIWVDKTAARNVIRDQLRTAILALDTTAKKAATITGLSEASIGSIIRQQETCLPSKERMELALATINPRTSCIPTLTPKPADSMVPHV